MKPKKAKPRKTMSWSEFQRLCFCNSAKIKGYYEICGRRKQWVGFGVIDLGPAEGDEVLIVED